MTLPRVTDILKAAGLIDSRWFSEWGRQRGSAVHLATRYLDEGRLDRGSLDDAVAPRVRQYERFLLESGCRVLESETVRTDHQMGYRGTPDRVVEIAGRVGTLDIKPPMVCPWHGIQLAAYAQLVARAGLGGDGMAGFRWILHLSDTAYSLDSVLEPADWPLFCDALNLYRWRERHGLLESTCPTS
jgi:hypothetical protein